MNDSDSQISGARSGFEWFLIVLLGLTPLFGPVFFGGSDTDIWSVAPFATASALAIFLFFARFLFLTRPSSVSLYPVPPAAITLSIVSLLSLGFILTTPILYETRIGLMRIFSYLGAFWAWTALLQDLRRGRILLAGLLITGSAIAIYATWQNLSETQMVLFEKSQYLNRASGTYRCPNHMANLLGMLIPFCLVLPFARKAGIFLRIFSPLALLTFLPPLYLSQSRAGWIGATVAGAVVLCLTALRKSKKLFIAILIAVPLLTAAGAILSWNYSELFRKRAEPVVSYFTKGTPNFRPLVWKDSLKMAGEKPLLGHGLRTWEFTYPNYRENWISNKRMARFAHNEYLNLLDECGALGLLLFSIAVGAVLVSLWRLTIRQKDHSKALLAIGFSGAFCGTLAHAGFDFNFQMFANPHVLALLGGIVAGPYCLANQRARETGVTHFKSRTAAVCGALLLLLFTLQYTLSGFYTLAGERAGQAGETQRAKEFFQKAIGIDNQNWRAHYAAGKFYHKLRYYTLEPEQKQLWGEREKRSFDKAFDHNRVTAEIMNRLGKANLFLNNNERALSLLERAARIKRNTNNKYYLDFGVALRKLGLYEEALKAFERAAELQSNPQIRFNIKWLREKIAQAEDK